MTHHPQGPVADCAAARDLISADADGELRDRDALEVHLDGCRSCRDYEVRVAALSRRVRLRAARHDAAFQARVMERARVVRLGRGGWLRPALAWCAILAAYHSVQPLFFGESPGVPTHIARHLGATSLALAIGFLVVAIKPYRAAGMLPFVAALGGTTIVAAVLDMASGSTTGVSEMAHASELIGMVLLWMIAGSPGWSRVTAALAAVRPTTR